MTALILFHLHFTTAVWRPHFSSHIHHGHRETSVVTPKQHRPKLVGQVRQQTAGKGNVCFWETWLVHTWNVFSPDVHRSIIGLTVRTNFWHRQTFSYLACFVFVYIRTHFYWGVFWWAEESWIIFLLLAFHRRLYKSTPTSFCWHLPLLPRWVSAAPQSVNTGCQVRHSQTQVKTQNYSAAFV